MSFGCLETAGRVQRTLGLVKISGFKSDRAVGS